MIKYISNNKELLDKLKALENKDNKINKWKGIKIMNHERGKRISINPYCDYGNKINQLIETDIFEEYEELMNNEVLLDEIPKEIRSYGCENGCNCFICIGKDKCNNWFIK